MDFYLGLELKFMRSFMRTILFVALVLFWKAEAIQAQQANRWQQRAEYTMEIDMDAAKHQFEGKQKLIYYNNSPDTLHRVFYHLYFNAFQPGSMMDIRSRTIEDPDRRVKDRIFHLKQDEIGYHQIKSLKQNGKTIKYEVVGTILEVVLDKPILPKSKTTFEMNFQSQVPLQVRRSGRDNKEGIEFSMSQWYPKMCEYDYQGWHANPYIGREFHGVWGDFDVKISMDSSYVIAATGYLQNPENIGHGYEKKGQKVKRPTAGRLTWHFKAPNVHDFVWAADPDYVHTTAQVPDGPGLHFFYQGYKESVVKNWEALPEYTIKAFQFMNKNIGKYPYKKYSVIQGGDGGMEYPMATLITGNGALGGLIGVTVHELIHSWFQGVLATNESLYAWMDEGFNSYTGNLFRGGDFPHLGSYKHYFSIVEKGTEEALTTHADHFNTNGAYSMAAYSKGAVFLSQLEYIIGKEAVAQGLLQYYDQWKFRHPNPNDFIRIMEKITGLELDWYLEYFVNTTHTIDYSIKTVESNNNRTLVTLERIGRVPMPLDVVVTYKNGTKEWYYIPLRVMRGEKKEEIPETKRVLKSDWAWTYPAYLLEIPSNSEEIKSIEIDPSQRMADVNRNNNVYPFPNKYVLKGK